MKQLKFLLTLVIIAAGFFYLQDKFNFLDISITPNNGENAGSKEDEKKGEKEQGEEKKDYSVQSSVKKQEKLEILHSKYLTVNMVSL